MVLIKPRTVDPEERVKHRFFIYAKTSSGTGGVMSIPAKLMSVVITLSLRAPLFAQIPADQEERQLQESMLRQMVEFSAIAMEEMDPEIPGICYAKRPDEHVQTPCYVLAWLYKNQHPLNPYFGDKKVFDRAVAICDRIAEVRSSLEWPMYNLSQVYSLLEEELDPNRKRAWLEYASHYVSSRGVKPYFYTSFNHEAWNALAVFRAGQVFAKPEWQEQGKRLMHQLLKLQTELGYFEEGPHHGPSMKYNHTQLAPMLLFADYANDRTALRAALKLTEFMIRYSFPDGSPIGTFDGRQSWSLGYYSLLCYGLDRWPRGKELNRRLYRTRKKWGFLSPSSPYYNLSDWYAYFGFGFLPDEFMSLKPEADTAPLPQDRNGYLMVDRGPSFGGGVARNHDWMVAISAINSDMPRLVQSPYQLERQSRLDVWHEKTGLIIGGGHNQRESEVPLANFHLVTGFRDVDCQFGRLSGGGWHDRRALYIPRKVSAQIALAQQRLIATFGQGDVALEVVPNDDKNLRIGYRWEVFTTKKLIIQLPLIIYHDSIVQIDGKPSADHESEPVSREVILSNPTMQSVVRITVPEGADIRLREPILPLRWYSDDHPPGRYEPFYSIRLLSMQVIDPEPSGKGEFWVSILS